MLFFAGGNGFYKDQTIDAGGGLELSGPLELEKDQRLSKLYIWLWQSDGDGTGAAATAVLDDTDVVSAAASKGGGAEWRTMVRATHGEFRAGPATGMALAILERNGRTTPYWWSDSNIVLAPTTTVTSLKGDLSALLNQAVRQALAEFFKNG